MILEKEYSRDRAVLYARKFALERNPLYYRFEGIGGNCTNFASQCVLAGSCVMNFSSIYGWYYLSLNRRSASWTGVEFFYDFFVNNTGLGPFAKEEILENGEIGDLIQLKNDEGDYYHTLVISQITEDEIYSYNMSGKFNIYSNSLFVLIKTSSTLTFIKPLLILSIQ